MKNLRYQKLIPLAVGLFSAWMASTSARAASVAVTYSYGLPIEEHPTEILESGLLPRFDTSMGTLIGASLEIHGSATTQISAYNHSASSVDVLTSVTTDMIWSSGLAPLSNLMSAQNNALSILLSSGPSFFLPAGETVSFGAVHGVDSRSFDLASILLYLQSSGYSTFDLNLQSLSGFTNFGGNANLDTFLTSTSGGGASITYTYLPSTLPSILPDADPDAVPEPGATLLTGLALLSATCQRRRRRPCSHPGSNGLNPI